MHGYAVYNIYDNTNPTGTRIEFQQVITWVGAQTNL